MVTVTIEDEHGTTKRSSDEFSTALFSAVVGHSIGKEQILEALRLIGTTNWEVSGDDDPEGQALEKQMSEIEKGIIDDIGGYLSLIKTYSRETG